MQNDQEVEFLEKIPLKAKLGVRHHVKEKCQVMTAKFCQQDSLVACGFNDGVVRIYNMVKSTKISQFNTNIKDQESNMDTPVNAMRWRPNSEKGEFIGAVLLTANTNGKLFQINAKNGKQLWSHSEPDNQIFAIDYCHDGSLFATAGRDNVIRIYDEVTKKTSHNLKGQLRHKKGHNNQIFAAKFRPETPFILASGGWDQNVFIWDLRVGEVTQTIVGPRITGDAIDFRQDMILTGANRAQDNLQLWDYRTQRLISTFTWDQKDRNKGVFLNSCQFCPNSKNTVVAAGGNQMKIFALDDYTQLLQVRFPENETIYSCDTSAINNKYLAGGKRGTLYYIAQGKTDK